MSASTRVGYSSRLAPITDMERALLDIPDVEVVELDLLTEDRLIAGCAGLDYVIVGAVEPVTRRVIETMDRVKLIARRGAGVNNVDIAAATEAGIGVTNVPDASVEEVSDHALALVLGLVRGIAVLDRAVRTGEIAPAREAAETAPRLSSMTVGVVGLGRIGRRFAEKIEGLCGELLGFDPVAPPEGAIRCVSFEELLGAADAVSLHVPLNPATRHMLDRRAFQLMKPGAFLVNTSRGELVDETALAEALADGTLGGAGLDVLADDPPGPDHPILSHERVIVTAHTAGKGRNASMDLRRRSVESVVAAIEGRHPANMINPSVWLSGPPQVPDRA